jgi:hypothetical protein
METSFYSANHPEYFHQKPHYDLANKVLHSSFYKSINPIRTYYDYKPYRLQEMPVFFGHYPQLSWLYGNLDYSFNKYHRHYQAHDEWYPDRKNKSLGFKQGGFMDQSGRNPVGITFNLDLLPRGCQREKRKYEQCKAKSPEDECFNQKISIMEVCPDHILESFREQKKWYLRAKTIDNQAYRRSMSVSDYNKGRSVTDLKLKDWSYGTADKMRSDGYWFDNRYDPTVIRQPHRYDTVNFPDKEYKDIFGGNWGQGKVDEKEKYKIAFWSNKSKAMIEVDEKLNAVSEDGDKSADKSEGESL